MCFVLFFNKYLTFFVVFAVLFVIIDVNINKLNFFKNENPPNFIWSFISFDVVYWL